MTSVPPAHNPDEPTGAPRDAASATVTGNIPGTGAAEAAARSEAASRRALGIALLCGALGAAFALVASGQVWSEAATTFAGSRLPVEAKGGDVTGLPSALALVGLAALVAVFAVRRAGRFVVAALLTLCGTGVVASAVLGAGDTSALDEKASEASGIAHTAVEAVHVSIWPYFSATGGVLLLLAGLLALRYGRVWPSMSGTSRYERAPARRKTARVAVDPDRPEDLWKALDRGEDPTRGPA